MNSLVDGYMYVCKMRDRKLVVQRDGTLNWDREVRSNDQIRNTDAIVARRSVERKARWGARFTRPESMHSPYQHIRQYICIPIYRQC